MVMYLLQGNSRDLFVSDQFYYFKLQQDGLSNGWENIDKRYYLFAGFMKFFYFLVGDEYLVYFAYVLFNGSLLMFSCRGFRKSNIVFFSFCYVYLSHGLLRDQLLLSGASFLARPSKFITETILIGLRLQLILMIEYRNRILNWVVPSAIFAFFLWHRGFGLSYIDVINAIKSVSTLPGVGFLTIEHDFPLSFSVMRILLGVYLFSFMLIYFLGKKMTLSQKYRFFLVLLTYVVAGVPIDIRIFLVLSAVIIGYIEGTK